MTLVAALATLDLVFVLPILHWIGQNGTRYLTHTGYLSEYSRGLAYGNVMVL